MQVTKTFYWSLEELCLVWMAYHAHVPITQVAKVLQRSYASIHKTIRRHRLNTPPQYHDAHLLWPELCEARHTHTLKNLCQWIAATEHKNWQDHQPTQLPSTTEKHCHYVRSRLEGTRWNHWADVIQTLQDFGVSIRKTTKAHYTIAGTIYNPAQVLLFTNRLRLERGLPVLWVEGVSVY